MKGFFGNIEKFTLENNNFREVIYTARHCQLVLMNLKPNEEIGEEIHELDQFFRFEGGAGKVIIDDNEYEVGDGDAVIVPQGAKHNVINTGNDDLKLYTLYSPPNHADKIIHATKADTKGYEEHFDGKTTE